MKMATNEVQKYWENSFQALHGEEDFRNILEYIHDHKIDAPTLYRGIYINMETVSIGDTLNLHDEEAFASMSPDRRYAWNFGNCVFVIEGLKGCPINEKEWLVPNEELLVEKIEYDETNETYFIYCR